MTQKTFGERALHEGLITAVAVGGFLIILGLVIALTPNIVEQANTFFADITSQYFPLSGTSTLHLPAPAHPTQHIPLFTAAMNFAIGIAILQIVILPLRIALKSPLKRIAETVGNLVFWVGAVIVANVFLLAGTIDGWFQYWSSLIIIVGISLVVRGLVHFSKRL